MFRRPGRLALDGAQCMSTDNNPPELVHTSEFTVNVEGKPKKRLELNEAAFKKHLSFRAVVTKKRSH